VDWSRRPFDCDAQPFPDSDQVVRIRFYPADKDAVACPFPSNIAVPDWEFDKEWMDDKGCVWAEWPGEPYNRAKAVPGSGRGHVCGTEEQFAGESKFDPAADMVYRPDGLPTCCDPRLEVVGGAGAAPLASVAVPPAPGPTCAAAGLLPLGVDVVVPFDPAGPANAWFKLPLTSGVGYTLTGRIIAGPSAFGCSGVLSDCVTPWGTNPIATLHAASGSTGFTAPTDTLPRLLWPNVNLQGTGSFTFRID